MSIKKNLYEGNEIRNVMINNANKKIVSTFNKCSNAENYFFVDDTTPKVKRI